MENARGPGKEYNTKSLNSQFAFEKNDYNISAKTPFGGTQSLFRQFGDFIFPTTLKIEI